MAYPQRPRTVVFGLPAPGPVPRGQPRAIPATPAPTAPTGIVINAHDIGRALPVHPARGAVLSRQTKVPTEIVARSDEVVVPVAHPPQNQAQAEPGENYKSLLPEGTPLLSVAGEKLPMSAVGPVLEFLEFCTAFYEPLEMKEVEGEWTLHEIVKGCKLNKGGQSPVARVHVHLLSVILNASGERYVLTRSAGKLPSANLPESSKPSYSFHNVTLRSDAVMTEAIVCENGSRAFWKLKGGDDRKAVICRVISDVKGTPKVEWTVYSDSTRLILHFFAICESILEEAHTSDIT